MEPVVEKPAGPDGSLPKARAGKNTQRTANVDAFARKQKE